MTTYFDGSSDGGTARVITNGNGIFDISGLTSSGMSIGSIEGSGTYNLGSKTLTVSGSNRLQHSSFTGIDPRMTAALSNGTGGSCW